MIFVIAFAVAIGITLALIPLFVKLAFKYDFTDKPTERKRHTVPVPLVGGIAMFFSFTVGFIIFVAVIGVENYYMGDEIGVLGIVAVLAGALLVAGIGFIDDFSKTRFKEFPIWPRILVKITAAGLAFAAGIRFTGFTNPFSETYVVFPIWLQLVLTVLWFVGLITVFNFMDGLDGLAGSLAILPGATLFLVAMYMGQSDSALMAVLFLGVVAGFLRYNLRGKVWMGDSGAYLLGYLLAVISLHGIFKQATLVSMFIPMLALAVPILDSIRVVVKRILARKPAYEADTTGATTHLHYRLTRAGLRPKFAVAMIFLLSACLNLMAIIVMLVV
ncbi:MAG: undecaprenyl/decaprenyl-phosphate alpha-N-acetylglucosaminyl 1-phosphate transferase [Defluviitaleaceae bacterium]|nr:undecaprenyl/decaprenyl-phosphate alpha-N-acetylglucosaminyl 1-phosphate transferase [Defluviitaleaceae bacterium]MCL2274648.1 undecaprenyl/decaprenyl-phosphate alpha-N-acetylglucosaminyl 1-phosphate transferase [Defluviitaleaceae bacterium]